MALLIKKYKHMIEILKNAGITIYPLMLLAIIALALIIDKILFYKKFVKLPNDLFELIETYDFSWLKLQEKLKTMPEKNCYRKFFLVIVSNKNKPVWWLESRTLDEAKIFEKELARGLWLLDTIVTAAPLLGLLGTIIGMMSSFKLIGAEGLLNVHGPNGVTAGVAEALIATAIGIFIALISLFAFNYFSKLQDQKIDEIERLATRMIDHVKLDKN